MEVLNLLTSFIDGVFIKSLFISILSIMLADKVLKTDTRNAFVIIRGLILVYAGLNISYYFIVYFSPTASDSFFERIRGPYSFAYYLMIVPNTILPLLLLFNRLGSNKYILLILSFLMNIGWVFDLFIIYSTDISRNNTSIGLSFNSLWFITIYGIFIGSVIYAIGRLFKHKVTNIDTPIS